MPMIEPVCVMSEAPARAIPKSVTLRAALLVEDHVVRLEVAVDRRRAGARSGRRAGPASTMSIARAGLERRLSRTIVFSERPARYSIAM